MVSPPKLPGTNEVTGSSDVPSKPHCLSTDERWEGPLGEWLASPMPLRREPSPQLPGAPAFCPRPMYLRAHS